MPEYLRDRIRRRQDERYYKKYPDRKPTPGAPGESSPPPQQAESNDDLVAATLISMQRDMKRQERMQRMDRQKQAVKDIGRDVKRLVPRGITLPDSMVRNRHLYTKAPRKRVRLF